MSTDLNYYMNDGANKQARAVLCMLQGMNVETSWNKEFGRYMAEPKVARWENCREQGYVVSLRSENGKHLHIAFFEHRNSDAICAIKWEQNIFPNSPTIDTADFDGKVYKDKWDVSKEFGCGKVYEMAEWIEAELIHFWESNQKKPVAP